MPSSGSVSSSPNSAAPATRRIAGTTDADWARDFEIRGSDATPGGPGWTVRKRTLRGGRQEGVETLTVDNGALEFTVILTRGMGLLSATMGDVRLGWDSPVREIVHPKFINLESRAGLGWLEGFNEWVVRCGLESNGGDLRQYTF